jgi:S-(hydroxymethyl)glutathione dehydrogenase/alcohol dehydrogenase
VSDSGLQRGVVFTEKVEVTDRLRLEETGPGEVRVRIEAAGLCHSDLSVIDRTIPFPTPVVLGHEGAGVVEEIGEGVTTVKPGDRVVLTTLGNCGKCKKCEAGRPTECPETFGKLPQPFTIDGEPYFQFANTSVFTDATLVRETQAIPVDERVPMEVAALLGCGVLTGTGAVFNRARVERGSRVGVYGIGGIGLNVIQAARIAGASTIVAVDTNPAKEDVARQFGATDFVNPAAEGVKPLRNMDYTFECVGHPAVIRNAIDALAWGGTCVILGVPPLGTEAAFDVSSLYQNKSIMGCRYGAARPRADIPALVDLYLSGQLKLDELISRTYRLEQFEEALADLKAGSLARGVFTL